MWETEEEIEISKLVYEEDDYLKWQLNFRIDPRLDLNIPTDHFTPNCVSLQ